MRLAKVKVINKQKKKEIVYTLVNEKEADLKSGKISFKSPIGIGLMGRKVGEVCDVQVPAGLIQLEIIDISL